MTNRLPTFAAVALFAMSIAPFANIASAMPVTDALAVKNAAPTNIETAQWRGRAGRGWRGGARGWGRGVGPGLLGGAIIGGMLAAPYYYGGGPYYNYAPGYDGDAVGYCMQRFRSYDPNSGTYLGNDGLRHSCP